MFQLTPKAPAVQTPTPAPQPDTEAIRAAFEADYFADAPPRARERSGDGYKYMAASVAWGTWQRAWAAGLVAQPAVNAARYQWLRDKADEDTGPFVAQGTVYYKECGHCHLWGVEMDAAIDAAMAGKGEKP